MKHSIAWRVLKVAVLITVVTASAVQAQQPTVVFSIRGIDTVLDDADFLCEEVGQAGIKAAAEQFISGVTKGKGLAGIDRTKPLGVYWNATADGPPEMPIAFLPVSDAAALKELLTELVPEFEETDGQWSASINGNTIYGKLSGGYLFLSPNLPAKLADPAKISNAKYDTALDISMAGIPAQFKQLFLDKVEEEGRKSQDEGPEPANETEKIGREWGFNGTLAIVKAIVNESDKLTLGIDLDRETRAGTIDLALTGQADSTLEKVLKAYGKIQPAFAGLGSDSTPFRMTLSLPTVASPEHLDALLASAKTALDASIDNDENLKSDEARDAAKKLIERLVSMTQATLKSGSLHAGVVLESGSNDTLRVVGAAKVADGNEAAKLLDEVIQLSKSDPDATKLKLDVAKHAGARIHAVTMDEDAQKNFGTDPAHLAFRNDSLWIAL
ncbi:MAG: hypothetical protein V4719_27030, partial [Planctomycetota bacterium]